MKEYKIDEKIVLRVELADDQSDTFKKCEKCFFNGLYPITACTAYPCLPNEREDGMNVVFVEEGDER